ncbi:hypothetical protein V6N13_112362 [Hibiscus sabdariffa]|uniref:Uncharacterized protein n=1 Tax=Hibiscus sabdariffa TaxID=183260 RepID=A0ABR2TNH4_9ROSI
MNSQVIHLAYLKAKILEIKLFGMKCLWYVNGSSLVMGRSAKLVWRYVNGSSLVMERSAMWVWRSSEEVFVGIAFSWHRVQWGLEKLDAYAG